jgi:guanylate kinase
VVLEIEVQGARQVRKAMPEAVQIFIAPPDPESLRERLEGRGTDSADAIERRLQTAEIELEAQAEFPHVIVNDEVQKAASKLESLVRGELSLH